MTKVEEIAQRLAQAIEKANFTYIYKSSCDSIVQVLCELRDRISDLSNQTNDAELDSILLRLKKLCETFDSFNQSNWYHTSLQLPIKDQISNINEIMNLLKESLSKFEIQLTNEYIFSVDEISDDLLILYGKIADPSLIKSPDVIKKLTEIEQYLNKIGKPLDVSQENDDDSLDEQYSIDEPSDVYIDQHFDFKDGKEHKFQKSDYFQEACILSQNGPYTICKGEMKLTKQKVNITILNKSFYDENKFKRMVNVLKSIRHPNLELFVGAVESPLPCTIITQRKGEKLSEILKREKKNQEEEQEETESDIEQDEKGNEIDQKNENETNDEENKNINNENNVNGDENNKNKNINNENNINSDENNENKNINNVNDVENNENSDINNEDSDENNVDQNDNEDNFIKLKPGYRTLIAYQIASAMSYLHSIKITHRDLCTSNISVEATNEVALENKVIARITNFASSRFVPDSKLLMSIKTPSSSKFRASEIEEVEGYTKAVDVFSFSGILYELLTNTVPFSDRINPNIPDLILHLERPKLPENTPKDLKDLIEQCWDQDQMKRPSFTQIVQTMITKKIVFPQDMNVEYLQTFYMSKETKNNDLKNCFKLINKIEEEISKSVVYVEEASKVRTYLIGIQHVLQTSKYAKNDTINDDNINIQINNIRISLDNIYTTIQNTQNDSWSLNALEMPALQIPQDLFKSMKEIFFSLDAIGFNVMKYDLVDKNLEWDLRYVYNIIKESNFECEKKNERIAELEDFADKNNLKLLATPIEITKYLFDWNQFRVKRSDFNSKSKKLIGHGSTCSVYKCTYIPTDEIVAIKELKKEHIYDQRQIQFLRREIAILSQVKNKYIIKFIGFNDDPDLPFWIVTEYVKNTLHHYISKHLLNPFLKTQIAFEIAQGMEYLRSKNILHRDLKPSNIMLKNNHPLICDFGFSRTESHLKMSSMVGTLSYMAPEVKSDSIYDFKADVFSFGMILWDFYNTNPSYKLEIKEDTIIPFNSRISEELQQLIIDTTNFDPKKRPTFTEIINRMSENNIHFNGCNSGIIRDFYLKKAQERESENQ